MEHSLINDHARFLTYAWCDSSAFNILFDRISAITRCKADVFPASWGVVDGRHSVSPGDDSGS